MQRILKLSRRLGWALLAGLLLSALAIQLSGHGYFWRALGATYLQGRPLLDKAFVERMRQPDLKPFYGHSLWMDWQYQHPFYFMQGHQGHYVIVVPSKQLVVVRLGQFRNKAAKGPNGVTPSEVYRFVDQAVALVS
jgi:CubicO group peptidase (beta-lactamase class C family)